MRGHEDSIGGIGTRVSEIHRWLLVETKNRGRHGGLQNRMRLSVAIGTDSGLEFCAYISISCVHSGCLALNFM
jgi:hypothetical protein